jgi:hypothetical protein
MESRTVVEINNVDTMTVTLMGPISEEENSAAARMMALLRSETLLSWLHEPRRPRTVVKRQRAPQTFSVEPRLVMLKPGKNEENLTIMTGEHLLQTAEDVATVGVEAALERWAPKIDGVRKTDVNHHRSKSRPRSGQLRPKQPRKPQLLRRPQSLRCL